MYRFILRHTVRLAFALSLIILLLSAALLVFSALVREDKGKQLKDLINEHLPGIQVQYEQAALEFSFSGAYFNAIQVTVTAGEQAISAANADIWWEPAQLRVVLEDAEFNLVPNDSPPDLPETPAAIKLSVQLSAPGAHIAFAGTPLTLYNADTNLAVTNTSWLINIKEHQFPYQLDLRASGDLGAQTVQIYAAGNHIPDDVLPAPLNWSGLHVTLVAHITDEIDYRIRGNAARLIPAATPAVTLQNTRWQAGGHCRNTTNCLDNIQSQFTAAGQTALPYNPAVTVTLITSGSGSRQDAHWHVTLSDLQLANRDVTVNASLNLGSAVSVTLLQAAGTISSMALSTMAHYAPPGEVKDWLSESVFGGEASGVFTLHTDTTFQLTHTTVQITAAFNDSTMVIADNWPLATALDGMLYISNDDIFIAGSGRYGTLFAPLVIADIPATAAELATLYLTVWAEPDALTTYFSEARLTPPIQDNLREADSEFSVTGGRGQLSLAVTVPLAQPENSRAQARITVQNGMIQVPDMPRYQSVRGNVAISNEEIRGKLSGRLDGMPLNAEPLETVFANTSLQLSGDISAPLLLSIAGFSDAPLSGTTPFLFSRNPAATVFSTPLSGIAIDLPEPLGKSAKTITPLTVTLAATIAARYQNTNLTLLAHITPDGSDIAINTPAAPPPPRGVNLRGNAATLNLDDWLNQSGGDGIYFAALQLTLTQVTLIKTHSDSLTINGHGGGGEPLSLHVDADNIAGTVIIDDNKVYGDFAELKLMLAADNNKQSNDSNSVNILSLTLALNAATVEINGLTLGQLSLTAAPRQDRWDIDLIRLSAPQITLDMRGHFQGQHTSLTILLEAGDLPALMTMLEIPPIFGHGAASLSGHIDWDGTPTDFDSDKLVGNIQLQGTDIRYVDVDLTTDVVSFLAVFSPASIFSLGFTDLAGGGGIVFQTVEGTITLQDGNIMLEPIDLTSKNLQMNIKGKTSYVTRQHDLYGRVRPGEKLLNASSTIGLSAGLVVINPASLVAGMFLGKLFEEPIAEIGAYNYTITGSWDKPVYTELSRFDDTSEKEETER